MELRVDMSKRFFWSNVASGVGWFLFLGGLGAMAGRAQDPTVETNVGPFMGLQIILGVSAYRSVKRTKLGLEEESFARRGLEITALVIVWHRTAIFVVALLFGKYNSKLIHGFYYEPATPLMEHLITPVWTFTRYVLMRRTPANTIAS